MTQYSEVLACDFYSNYRFYMHSNTIFIHSPKKNYTIFILQP